MTHNISVIQVGFVVEVLAGSSSVVLLTKAVFYQALS